jgi:hypothetical protein
MNHTQGATASLQAGKRFRSQNSTCEVIVVRGTSIGSVLMCAGAEMVEGCEVPARLGLNGSR